MRRLIIVEPVAPSALWSRRLAIVGLTLAGIAVVASRSGTIEPPAVLALLVVALLFALLAVMAALAAAVAIWRTGHPGVGTALGGLVLAALLLAYPAWLAATAGSLPALSDVSTDPSNPLAFSSSPHAVKLRRAIVHDTPQAAERQAQTFAYPEVKPLTLDVTATDVYKAALKLVAARRWTLVEAQGPAGRPAIGHIEAVAKSPIMGFPDDISIRIAAVSPNQSRVDMRSASRYGVRDLGANAARIEAFMADLDDAAGDE